MNNLPCSTTSVSKALLCLGALVVSFWGCALSSVAQDRLELGLFGGGSYYLGEMNPSQQFKKTRPAAGFFARYMANDRIASAAWSATTALQVNMTRAVATSTRLRSLRTPLPLSRARSSTYVLKIVSSARGSSTSRSSASSISSASTTCSARSKRGSHHTWLSVSAARPTLITQGC